MLSAGRQRRIDRSENTEGTAINLHIIPDYARLGFFQRTNQFELVRFVRQFERRERQLIRPAPFLIEFHSRQAGTALSSLLTCFEPKYQGLPEWL